MIASKEPVIVCGRQYPAALKIGFDAGERFLLELALRPDGRDSETSVIGIATRDTRLKTPTLARVTADAPHRITIFDDWGTPHEIAGETPFIAALVEELRGRSLVTSERAIRVFGDVRLEHRVHAPTGMSGYGEQFRIVRTAPKYEATSWAPTKALAWFAYRRLRRGERLTWHQLCARRKTLCQHPHNENETRHPDAEARRN